ncbi:MAG: GNAT family N-acetyltransferase [Oscillospiraceae bacterium]|nr:GNAT family N-acetyltransferase [Oscillospiraceae bacterium]
MIRPASEADLAAIRHIVRTTIEAVYPQYYPQGAVQFFLSHHNDEAIRKDLAAGCVYLCEDGTQPAGTVTIRGNEILRLFVLPEYQGHGFGRALLDLAEQEVAKQYAEIRIDASFAAKAIYLKRGYKETAYHTIRTENGDFLCYDVMHKPSPSA